MPLQQTLQSFRNHFKTKRRHQPAKKRTKRRLILELLESRVVPTVSVINNFDALVAGGPPDTCGAAGPNSYVESVNDSVAIYNKSTGAAIVPSDYLDHFLFTVGGITKLGGLTDATMAYDEVTGQFIVGDLDIGASNACAMDIAVSKTSNPTTLDGASWNFYQITMTEGNLGPDYPGNMGFNADAFVFTINIGNQVEVAALSQSSLAAEGTVTGRRFNATGYSMRPVTMHDSVAGGPMWLVSEGGGKNSINLLRIDNILTAPAQTPFQISVNAYNSINPPLNANGTQITTIIDTKIMKAAEANNFIVACQHVGVGSNEDDARWYEFDVSNINSPSLVQQGNVGFGPNTYTVFPGIDINAVDDIGMSFIRSGNDSSTDYMSVYVTGRISADTTGTMETPVLVRGGDSNDSNDGREGDFSGINVDPNGTFWIANEYSQNGSGATEVAHFTFGPEAFINNGVLWVTGTNANDNVTLQVDLGNYDVLDNGVLLGDPTIGEFSSVNVSLFGGNDTVNVENTLAGVPVTIKEGDGTDTVNISPSAELLDNIQENVIVIGGSGIDTLNVYDQNDIFNDTWTITGATLTRTAAATVFYTEQNNVNITGGSGSLTYNILSTEAGPFFNGGPTVTLDTGTGTDTVNVQSTGSGSTLNIEKAYLTSNSSRDTVNIGSNAPSLGGTLGNIAGAVNVSNRSGGGTTLTLDDSGDTTGQTVLETNSSITGTWAPGAIGYTGGQVTSLILLGGSGGNTFNVQSTASGTTTSINTDDALVANTNNHVIIGSNAPSLTGTLANIAGPVNVSSSSGSTTLTLDDSSDTTGQSVFVTNSSVSGTWSAGGIGYTGGQVTSLKLLGGDGGNTFNVLSTAAGTATSIDTDYTKVTNGNNAVNIGSNAPSLGGTLANIAGPVNVSSTSGGTSLIVDDSGDSGNHTVDMYDGALDGLAPAAITWTPNASGSLYGGVNALRVLGSTGSNTFNVHSTSAFYFYTWLNGTGGGSSTVNVQSTQANVDSATYDSFYADGGSGFQFVTIGSQAPSPGSTGANINGTVQVYNSNVAGSSWLSVDDSGDSGAKTATLSDGLLTGLSPASISWRDGSSSTGLGGVEGLYVFGGTAANTFNVSNTSNFFDWSDILTGAGADTVNVSATTGGLYIHEGSGITTVNVGNSSNKLDNIQGFVDPFGGSAANHLNINDQGNPAAFSYIVTNSSVSRGGAPSIATILYSGQATVALNGSSGSDTYNIASTAAGTATTVNAGAGNDTFNVGNGNVLDGILGALTVNGAGGTNTMSVNDQNAASHSYILTASTLTRSGSAAITYLNLKSIVVNGGSGTNSFVVQAMPTIAVTLKGNGAGTNTLFGPNASNTFAITGTNSGTLNTKVVFSGVQNLTGGNTSDDFKFSGAGNLTGNLDGGTGAGTDKLDYSALGATPIAVNLGTQSASRIGGVFSNIISLVGSSTATTNTLTGPNTTNLWDITGADLGKVNLFSFSAIQNLVAGNVNDTFKFASSAGKVSNITGGAPAQGDWLDYSAFTAATPVTVNLLTGHATNVSGSISGIENVISGAGADTLTGNNNVGGNILIAHGGNATINGGSHRSILIGGSGNSHINGGSGGDLMIGGKTSYDTTSSGHADLMIILAEWASGDPYTTRTDEISDGTIAGHAGVELTVTLNASSSTEFLKGSSSATDLDWFWATTSAQHSALETVSGVTELVNKDPN